MSDRNTSCLVQKYRALRLEALRIDPEAFASSYDEESKQGDAYFLDRLKNPKAAHFVATPQVRDYVPSIIDDWIGMVVMLGPEFSDEDGEPSAKVSPWIKTARPCSSDSSIRGPPGSTVTHSAMILYHLTSSYIVPSWRRRGVGMTLFGGALKAADETHRGVDRCRRLRCTVHVEEDNMAARNLYDKLGFVKVGEERYLPRPTKDGPRPERLAIVMQRDRQVHGGE